MRDKKAEARKWQKENLRRYELYAAKRLLKQAVVFLIFFTLVMFIAVIAATI